MKRSGILLVVLAAALAGCGSTHHEPSPIKRSEAKVEAAAERNVEQVASSADDWLVYGRCRSASRCTAELRSLGLPERTLAVDHYRVKGGAARRVNPSAIEVFLVTDSYADCTGKYLATENPAALEACAGGR